MGESRRAVVTGASSGIGAATVRLLCQSGWEVVAMARREEQLRALADETGAYVVVGDVTSDDDVARLKREVTDLGGVDALVNNAGGAIGMNTIGAGVVADWQTMFEVNVLGVLRVTSALLPLLRSSGRGDVVMLSSTAGLIAYEKGGGYVATKHGTHAIAATLRLEEAENDIRVIEIAPGMVKTEEFALKRFDGNTDAAAAVYAGVAEPLTAADIAAAIVWSVMLPHHMNVDLMVLRPLAQAAQHKVIRRP
jgi:NADP-dependent 3-hydroxy acid dehydrogenase YdfG